MPSITATIDRDQRDGLYELVRNHLGAIGDVWIALEENGDFAAAERLGIEFGEDFRLLADVGWQPKDDREAFELTMPTHDRMKVRKRWHDESERVLLESGPDRESKEAEVKTYPRLQLGRDACEKVLVGL